MIPAQSDITEFLITFSYVIDFLNIKCVKLQKNMTDILITKE